MGEGTSRTPSAHSSWSVPSTELHKAPSSSLLSVGSGEEDRKAPVGGRTWHMFCHACPSCGSNAYNSAIPGFHFTEQQAHFCRSKQVRTLPPHLRRGGTHFEKSGSSWEPEPTAEETTRNHRKHEGKETEPIDSPLI